MDLIRLTLKGLCGLLAAFRLWKSYREIDKGDTDKAIYHVLIAVLFAIVISW